MAHEHEWTGTKFYQDTEGKGVVLLTCGCGEQLSVQEFVKLTEQRCRELEDAGDAIVGALKYESPGTYPVSIGVWDGLRGTPVKPLEDSRDQLGRTRFEGLLELLAQWHGCEGMTLKEFLKGLDELK